MSISSVKTGAIGDSLLAGNAAYDPGNFVSIATASGDGSSSLITFTGIPSTYTHLQIRGIARNTATGTTPNRFNLNFNGDTGSNYASHSISGNGTSVTATAAFSNSQMRVFGTVAGGGVTANAFNPFVIDILDYTATAKYKTIRVLTGGDYSGSGGIYLDSAMWQDVSVITTIDILSSSGAFDSSTKIALYGIKG